jgi:acyl-CoA thioester hydrolase
MSADEIAQSYRNVFVNAEIQAIVHSVAPALERRKRMSRQDGTEQAPSTLTRGQPIDPGGFQFWVEEKLRNMDTDQFGHVNNAAIASFCESGRMSLFAGEDVAEAMKPYSPVVVRLLLEFHAEVFFPGAVRVGTNVVDIGNTSFQVVQCVFKGNDRVASSMATCVLIDRATRKPVRVPEFIRERLQSVQHSHFSSNVTAGAPDAH